MRHNLLVGGHETVKEKTQDSQAEMGGHTQEMSQGSFVCATKGDWFQLAPVWKLFFRPESREQGNLPVPRMTHSQAAEAGSQQGGGGSGLFTPCVFRARNRRHVPCSTGGNEASSEGERE